MSSIITEEWNQKKYLVARMEEGEYLDEDCLAAVSGNIDGSVRAEGAGRAESGLGTQESPVGTEAEIGIQGILPVSYVQLMDRRMLRYDVNAYLPFVEYKREIRSEKDLRRVLLSVLDILAAAESYLLEPAYFLLKQEYVYIKPETGKAWLALCPVYDEAGREAWPNGDLLSLFQSMLKGIRLPEEGMAFYGKLIYELDQGETFNRVTFGKFLRETEGSPGTGDSTAVHDLPEADFSTYQEANVKNPISSERESGGGFLRELFGGRALKPEKAVKEEKSKTGEKGSKKEKNPWKKAESGTEKSRRNKRHNGIRLPDEEELLPMLQTDDEVPEIPSTDDELPARPVCRRLFLRRPDTGERIPVTGFPFEIGREGNGLRVDLSKTKVSRKHAVIFETAEGYAIRDISKHGTFLDGKRIPREKNVPLKNGAKILLKEVEYVAVVED